MQHRLCRWVDSLGQVRSAGGAKCVLGRPGCMLHHRYSMPACMVVHPSVPEGPDGNTGRPRTGPQVWMGACWAAQVGGCTMYQTVGGGGVTQAF